MNYILIVLTTFLLLPIRAQAFPKNELNQIKKLVNKFRINFKKKSTTELVELLSADEFALREGAQGELIQRGKESVEYLIGALSSDPESKWRATRALVAIARPALPGLMDAAEKNNNRLKKLLGEIKAEPDNNSLKKRLLDIKLLEKRLLKIYSASPPSPKLIKETIKQALHFRSRLDKLNSWDYYMGKGRDAEKEEEFKKIIEESDGYSPKGLTNFEVEFYLNWRHSQMETLGERYHDITDPKKDLVPFLFEIYMLPAENRLYYAKSLANSKRKDDALKYVIKAVRLRPEIISYSVFLDVAYEVRAIENAEFLKAIEEVKEKITPEGHRQLQTLKYILKPLPTPSS